MTKVKQASFSDRGKKKLYLKILIVFLLMISCFALQSQDILQHRLDNSETGKSLPDYLISLEKKYNAKFYFLPEWIDGILIKDHLTGLTVEAVLRELFSGSDLSFFSMYPNLVVILKDPKQALLRRNALEAAIEQNKKIDTYVFGTIGTAKKESVIISGRIINAKTGEPMPRINVRVNDTGQGTSTDDKGEYKLSLSAGAYVLSFSFVNFEHKVIDLAAFTDGEINLEMEEAAIVLDEIVIQQQVTPDLSTIRIGQTQLIMRDLKRAPAFLGEVDLIRQVQNLPGVTTVGEAASGFNVRGGSVDQNLILYDDLPLFNSSHVFGFLSAFNSEAIREVSFYRGGIPAEYGGRVSSVLDIQSKDGNTKQWNINGGIGMITSNIVANGPLKKDKTALAASFRSTYSNWLIHSIRTDYADLRNSSVFFYDATAKLTHFLNERTKISVSGYSSKDAFRLVGDSLYQWDNYLGSLRIDHQLSPTLESAFTFGMTSYGYDVINEETATASKLSFRINTSTIKAGFSYLHNGHKINFGNQFLYYRFNPGSLSPESALSNARSFALDRQRSLENSLYISDEFSFHDKLFIEAGLRIPVFVSFGRASVNIYENGLPREIQNITDTLNFRSGEPIKSYLRLEPRLSMRATITPTSSVKVGYNRMYQFLHLISNTTAVTPIDIWQPSGYYFKPQRADQVSAGYFIDSKNKQYSASGEVYYKILHNILDFKDGAQLVLNRALETDLLQGTGESYGIETYLAKNTGRFTGTLNYTYSRSFRVIRGNTSSETLNAGKRYPANFDQPHIVNLAWKYNLSRRHFFTGNFTYHSGRPVTIPLSAFAFENTTVAYFSERNQYRIPDYHRLDLAFVIEGNYKRNQRWKGSWVFSAYNVYARKNPYTIFFKSSQRGVPEPYQLSIIGTILPSVSYNFKF